jgi:hypothetical protein
MGTEDNYEGLVTVSPPELNRSSFWSLRTLTTPFRKEQADFFFPLCRQGQVPESERSVWVTYEMGVDCRHL